MTYDITTDVANAVDGKALRRGVAYQVPTTLHPYLRPFGRVLAGTRPTVDGKSVNFVWEAEVTYTHEQNPVDVGRPLIVNKIKVSCPDGERAVVSDRVSLADSRTGSVRIVVASQETYGQADIDLGSFDACQAQLEFNVPVKAGGAVVRAVDGTLVWPKRRAPQGTPLSVTPS